MKHFTKLLISASVLFIAQQAAAAPQPETVCTAKFVVDGTKYTQQILVLTGENDGVLSVRQLKPRVSSIAMYRMEATGELKLLKKAPHQLRWTNYRLSGSKLLLKLEDDLVAKCEFKR